MRRFVNTMEDDLVPRNAHFCALNRIYQFQYIRVGRRPRPLHMLTVSVPAALVPTLPQGVGVIQAGICKNPN